MEDMTSVKSNKLRILFVGDTAFGENYQEKYSKEGGKNILKEMGYDHPFQNLKHILLQSDFVIANLETPITNNLKFPIPVKTKKNFHWSDVKNAPQHFSKYNMKIFSLANNHTLDYGLDGLKQTLEVLYKNGIEWIGAGLDKKEAQMHYYKEFRFNNQVFKLAIITGFESRKTYDQDFVFYANKKNGGVNRLSIKRIAKQIKQIKETIPDVYVVIFPHWGKNYRWKSEKQSRFAHEIIDAGADLIVGHGAHMMQEIEKYHGHWILYSVGNFMYNPGGRYQKFNVEPFSLITQLSLHESDGNLVRTMKVYPILTDNKITNFQTRFLTEGEFEKAHKLLLEKNSKLREFETDIKTGKDDVGRFMEFGII